MKKLSKKQNTQVRMAALLLSTGLIAAACGADTITADAASENAAAEVVEDVVEDEAMDCLLYTSPSPRD